MEGNVLLGDEEVKSKWMVVVKVLVDDFWVYKQFYFWDKYIKFLGYVNFFEGGQQVVFVRNLKFVVMEECLCQNFVLVDGVDLVIVVIVNKFYFKIF